MSKNIMDTIKSNLLPGAVSIIAMFIWRDINELKSDVKELLAQSNVDKTKIENLERIIYEKKDKASQTAYLLQFDKYFKHEDFFDIKKYIAQNKN